MRVIAVASVLLLSGAARVLAEDPSAGLGANDPAARFHGAPIYDFAVTNVKWEAATPEYSYVTFDLSWSFSWRAKWVEPAATSVTGRDMEVENWDAAWVFVKFLPEKDSKESIERNHWLHATLDKDSAHHVMPPGATNSVKMSDDSAGRGMGVFIYRDAVGHGVNDWKGIKLRWLHGADPSTGLGAGKVDPAKAAVRAYAIPMVYVPEGAFHIGASVESGYTPFPDGPDIPVSRLDGEQNFGAIPEVLRKAITQTTSKDGGPYLRWTDNNATCAATDGGWRGGKTIPFLLDKEWNGPVAAGTRARRMGPAPGCLWNTHTFSERSGSGMGGLDALNDDYPTGYDAFYCMKHDVTQRQYCDFLNSLPPAVAAARAFVSHEQSSDASMHSKKIIDKLPSGAEVAVVETAGNTIRSSADVPERPHAATPIGEETKEKDGMDMLIEGVMAEKSKDGTTVSKVKDIPVYWARLPFRQLRGVCWADTRAFAVWAGLRPITGPEATKASSGFRSALAPPLPPSSYDARGGLVLADEGQPNERPLRGSGQYGDDFGIRVGCFSTPTSDQATAHATYWGITDFGPLTVPMTDIKFRGSHGDGNMPAGTPGASWKRKFVDFTNTPPDWSGRWWEYPRPNARFASHTCRLASSADNRVRKPAAETDEAPPRQRKLAAQFPPADARRDDIPRVANVKVEPGKEYSTVSFDLSWQNSWRAKWEEPAEKNVTGKPLKVESWDAAWVIVKFRPMDAKDEGPALLAAGRKDHLVPAGAELDVGLTDEGDRGVGVFIYRNAIGTGPNDFKGVKLRWKHGADVDPAKGEVKVYAIAMVYIPEGPFVSRSPWGHPLTTITTPDSTQPGGYLDSGTNDIPTNPEWPNGYTPFYCMKYSISQGQYADMLNSAPSKNYKVTRRFSALAHNNPRLWHPAYYGFNGYTITTNTAGVFKADVPDRMCPLLSEADITFFTVWAGLRLMTDLEYEKACRGPRAVAKGGDAWTPATCGPAAGLDKSVLAAPSAIGPGPSYWGIRELSLSGCVQEWPSVVASVWGWGKKYMGGHSTGAMEDPDDWPWGWFANLYYGGIWRCPGYGTVGHWVDAAQLNNMDYALMDAERCGRYGVRAVRTANPKIEKDSPLAMDQLPNLAGYDIGIAYLSGRFNNTGDKPLKVELVSTLPAACFLQGAASRVFTATAQAVTPFKMPVVLTRALTRVTERRGRWLILPVQIKEPGGETLDETKIRVPADVLTRPSGVVQSLDGGKIDLKVRNATESPLELAFEMPSLPAVRIGETKRTLTVAAGAEAVVAFPVPQQWFPQTGPCRIPYRVTIGGSAALDFETSVELRTQTRWWIMKRVKAGPNLEGDDEDRLKGPDDLGGLAGAFSDAGDVFTLAAPSKGWKSVMCGSAVTLGETGPLPSRDSKAMGATRVIAAADADTVVVVRPVNADGREISMTPPAKGDAPFLIRAWVNDSLAFDSRLSEKERAKSARLRKGANTVVVEWQTNVDGGSAAASIAVQFNDAKTGKPVPEVFFDMDKR